MWVVVDKNDGTYVTQYDNGQVGWAASMHGGFNPLTDSFSKVLVFASKEAAEDFLGSFHPSEHMVRELTTAEVVELMGATIT